MKVLGFVSLAWSTGLLLTDQGSEGTVASDDELMFIDEECLRREQISNPGIQMEICNDTLSLKFPGSPWPTTEPRFEVIVDQHTDSDAWRVMHSWPDNCDGRPRKILYKAKFRSTGWNVRFNACVQFTTQCDKLPVPHVRWFPCLRANPGDIVILYISEVQATTFDKHEINTECKCPNQNVTARLDGPNLVEVSFQREARTSGYQVSVIDRHTENEIDTTGIVALNVSQGLEVLKRFIDSSTDRISIKVQFWCSNYRQELKLDTNCKEVIINISGSTPSASNPAPRNFDFFKSDMGLKVALLAVVLVVVAIAVVATILVFKRRYPMLSNDSNGVQMIQEEIRTNYSPVSSGYTQLRSCAILFQPDSSNPNLEATILNLENKLEARGIQVFSHPRVNLRKSLEAAENWCSVSEKIANEYHDIIFVTSLNFNLLWSGPDPGNELQKSVHERLLADRQQENIPCSILNILQAKLVQRESIKPGIYIVSLNCVDTLKQAHIFFKNAPFLSSIATVYCLDIACKGHTCRSKRGLNVGSMTKLFERF